MEVTDLPRRDFARTWECADITVRQDGGGRTVDAWITPFDRAQEIRDGQGHYNETIGRTAFSKTLAERGLNFAVLFNHGRTYDGRTDGALMVPVGVPREISDQHDRGLFSATEYLENPLADAILDGVKKGAIRGYSFSGAFMKSKKTPAAQRGGLPTIHRSEVAMREYGPVLFPAYDDATILGVRSVQSFITELGTLDPEDIEAFRHLLGIATPLEPATATTTATPVAGQPATDDPATSQSTRHSHQRLRLQARQLGVMQ